MGKKAKRKAAKAAAAQGVQARYDAAGTGRRLSGWNTPSSGPNTAIGGLQKIRDRARDLARNEWSGAANVRVWTSNMIGTGIVPRPRTKNKRLKNKLTQLWRKWVEVADADGVLDFYGLQALVVRTWFTCGEAFVRIRPRRAEDGLPVPLQLQVLEGDMVPLLDADVYPGMPAGHTIRQGVEFNRIGRRVAYWMYRNHPGDTPRTLDVAADLLYRVPAETVCHIFEPLRPGQIRGVPEMASVITRLRNVGDFDDALLERQRLANLFAMFVIKPMPSSANDPMTSMPYAGSADEPLATLMPGTSQELLPGEDVRFSAPPGAGADYGDYMRWQHLGVTAGAGTPYELATGDIKDVSDRTLRILINEFRRLAEQRQWLIFIPQLCQKVRSAWSDFAVLAGELTLREAEAARDVQWAPQGWEYIHPVQDVQGKLLEIEGGLRSRSDVISARGNDPDEVDEERAEDAARAKRLGLSTTANTNGKKAPPTGNGEVDDDVDDGDDGDEVGEADDEANKAAA